MKKLLSLILALVCIALLSWFLLTQCEGKAQEKLFNSDSESRSISFIMGEDKQGQNYFELATRHFLNDQEEASDIIINSCRTLDCIVAYLNQSEDRGTLPWSTINVVAHGNPNTGLNLNISMEGHKATPKRLLQTVLLDSFPRLKDEVVDSNTQINFWSCGIGKSIMMNQSLKQLVKTDSGQSVSTYCSPYFVIFKESDKSATPKRLNLSYWPYYYKRGYRPSDSEIIYAMRKQFPDEDVQWSNALDRELKASVFHEEYHIPASYLKIYENKSDRPDFNSPADKIIWIKSQSSLMDQVAQSGIPFDKFKWQVNKIIHKDENGISVPAVKAIGMATVLNFLKPSEA